MSGASMVDEIEAMLATSGVEQVRVVPKDESKMFVEVDLRAREWLPLFISGKGGHSFRGDPMEGFPRNSFSPRD